LYGRGTGTASKLSRGPTAQPSLKVRTVETKPLTLIIKGLTLEEAKQLTKLIWEMAEKDPTRNYLCVVQGLEDKTFEETNRALREIFPMRGEGG